MGGDCLHITYMYYQYQVQASANFDILMADNPRHLKINSKGMTTHIAGLQEALHVQVTAILASSNTKIHMHLLVCT